MAPCVAGKSEALQRLEDEGARDHFLCPIKSAEKRKIICSCVFIRGLRLLLALLFGLQEYSSMFEDKQLHKQTPTRNALGT
jgi:hypothetical protein